MRKVLQDLGCHHQQGGDFGEVVVVDKDNEVTYKVLNRNDDSYLILGHCH